MKPEFDKLDQAMKAAREKAEKDLDYNKDGQLTSKDFFATKKGRRALAIGALVVFILLAIAFGGKADAAQDEPAQIPLDCGQSVCVIPKAVLFALLKGHNDTVDENARLKAQLDGRPIPTCPGLKPT